MFVKKSTYEKMLKERIEYTGTYKKAIRELNIKLEKLTSELARVEKMCDGGSHTLETTILESEAIQHRPGGASESFATVKHPIIVQTCTKCTYRQIINEELYSYEKDECGWG